MNTLSSEIKAARVKAKFTQQEIAEKIGVSTATYIKYENYPLGMPLEIFCNLSKYFCDDFKQNFFTIRLYELYKKESET